MFFTDQLNRIIELKTRPKRIISLVPSQTEFLFDIGLEEELVGLTKFCIHPEKLVDSKVRIGGTKTVNFEKVFSLKPDLIIGNKEENDQSQIFQLIDAFPVWMSDIKNLDDAFEMMLKLGEIGGKPAEANRIVSEITDAFLNHRIIQSNSIEYPLKRAAYLIWNNPLMSINKDTFIHDMLIRNGFENVFANEKLRYPEIDMETLKKKNPEIIILSSEPFPFNQIHRNGFMLSFPNAEVVLADGELFSWYGSRLRYSPPYFDSLFKPKT